MTILQAVVLGVVQGLTEFLPVSSSAHLVIVPWALGWEFDPAFAFAFDVLVQMGTLLAVIIYFASTLREILSAVWSGLRTRRPLEDPLARLGWLIVLATIPAVLAGLLFHDAVEAAFGNPRAVFFNLLVTASLLAGAERFGRPRRGLDRLNAVDAVAVGAAQALALLPGVSRSGSTISAGLFRGLQRPEAARFSFLMSVPAMIGAGLVGLKDRRPLSQPRPPSSGRRWIRHRGDCRLSGHPLAAAHLAGHRLTVFAVYCFVIGIVGLVLTSVNT
jgi:undecaprenyl-diphosphatase